MHDVDFRPTSPGIRGRLESLQVGLLCQNGWLATKVNAIIVHGTKLKYALISRGISENKICVIPHFDYGYLLPLSSKLESDNSYENVLLFGKIKPYKAVEILLEAAPKVRKKLGNFLEKELLEDYLKVVELLTFNDESSMRRRVDTLLIEKSRIDMLEAKIQKLERKHGKVR